VSLTDVDEGFPAAWLRPVAVDALSAEMVAVFLAAEGLADLVWALVETGTFPAVGEGFGAVIML
jgi:hypothetical protein